MLPFLHLLTFLFAATCVSAARPLKHQVCGASCYYALLKTKYAAPDNKTQIACSNHLRVTSIYYCMAIHCKEVDVSPGIGWMTLNCPKSGKVFNEKSYRSTVSNATEKFLASIPTVDLKHKAVVNGTAVPSVSSWFVVYRTVHTYDHMRYYANSLRFIPYGFWAIVLIVGMIDRATQLFGRKHADRTQVSASNTEKKSTSPAAFSKLKSWVRRNLLMSPTFAYHHHQPMGWFHVPLRLQTLVVAGYIIIHIAVCAPHYPIYDESYYYTNRRAQVLRYFGDRLAALTSSSLPLLFLFGGRGNIFIPLTGWSYRTFNIFHRWIGIVMLIEGVIHGVVFSAYYVNTGNWASYQSRLKNDLNVRYGILVGVATGLTVGLASSPVRARAYEVFKAWHLVFSAIILAGFYEHIKNQFGGVYKVWVWMCVGIWSGDRVLRLLRALVMNYKTFIGRGTSAMASYSEDTGMIRLQVYPSVMPSRQTPGIHYFLYFPGWRLWESHPFSLAGRSTDVAQVITYSSAEPKSPQSPNSVTEQQADLGLPYLTFMIRPQNGMTRRLRDKLRKQGSTGPVRMKVLLDGPYGSAAQLSHFDDIIFIAGGSGITAVLPYVRSLFEDQDSIAAVPNVRLVWAAKDEGFARDVFANDLARTHSSPAAETKLHEEIYITRTLESESDTGDSNSNSPRGSSYSSGRPDVDRLVGDFIRGSNGKKAVFVCGPAKMADDARAALLKHASKDVADVELFEEMYGW